MPVKTLLGSRSAIDTGTILLLSSLAGLCDFMFTKPQR
jgi:hypothetical protein